MFDKLIELWLKYKEAMALDPYDAVAVQGRGIVFCSQWMVDAPNIMAHLDIKEKDFSYNQVRFIMPRLMGEEIV